jgi:hypothetical protein
MSIWKKHESLREELACSCRSALLVVVAIGGLVEIAPLFYLQNTIEKVEGMRPYTPLELAGRNIYIREGCYLCHSQMVRRCATRWSATATSAWRRSPCTTTPSSGARSGPVRTLPASAANTPTSGTSST